MGVWIKLLVRPGACRYLHGEEAYIGSTGAYGGVADAKFLLQDPERFHEADDGGLAGEVERRLQRVDVSPKACNPEEIALDLGAREPVVDGDLGETDGSDRVDAECLVLAYRGVGTVGG